MYIEHRRIKHSIHNPPPTPPPQPMPCHPTPPTICFPNVSVLNIIIFFIQSLFNHLKLFIHAGTYFHWLFSSFPQNAHPPKHLANSCSQSFPSSSYPLKLRHIFTFLLAMKLFYIHIYPNIETFLPYLTSYIILTPTKQKCFTLFHSSHIILTPTK